jgi:hypothetical protein
MIKKILKLGIVTLLAAAVVGLPAQLSAQSTNPPAGTNGPPPMKKMRGHPFHGKLAEVDKTAKTIKVGETTYEITSKTRIMKDGKPGTLEDGVVGEDVSGSATTDADGKHIAASVYFGKRPGKAPDSPQPKPAPTQ